MASVPFAEVGLQQRVLPMTMIGSIVRRPLVWLAAAVTLGMAWAAPASAQSVVVIEQVSSGRVLSAYGDAAHDYRVQTKPRVQYDTNQAWFFYNYGAYATFEQVATGRFLDAHEIESLDFHLVTRPTQNNNTQRWVLTPMGGDIYTIQQQSNGRYMDAHEYAGMDFGVVTRPAQGNNTQLWRITVIDRGP